VEADLELLREAARRGATISLATDSHCVEDIGRFDYHLDLMERADLRLEDLRLFAPR
jgi:histidinol phosphatase-like PHP family hydrolase